MASSELEKRFGQSDPELAHYAYDVFRPEDETLLQARRSAESRGLPTISLDPFEARHLEIFVRMMNAKKAVEIGTLGGYSGIAIARGMGFGGKLHTFDLHPHHAEVARQAFERANLVASVVVHAGPALENLPRIAHEAPFDLVFIEADKANYPRYLSWATDHLRVGGAIIADNTFAYGKIHRAYALDGSDLKEVNALREFNHIVATSGRFRSTILPTEQGMTVAIKLQ